jgi:hypothetical protein
MITMPKNTSRNEDIDQETLGALVQSMFPEMTKPQSFSIVETYQHHDKTLVFCQLVYLEPPAQGPEVADLVVKFYSRKGEADCSCAAQQYLWQAGFDTQPYCVPRLYGCASEGRVLVQQRATGHTWAQWLKQAPSLAAQMAPQVAGWLVHLQQTPLPPQMPPQRRRKTPAQGLAEPRRLLQELAASFPAQAPRLEGIGTQLQERRPQLQGLPILLAHGDFHPGNVMFTPEKTTLIDFDAYGVHEAAFDVGYCIGQLLSMSYFRCGSIAPGAAAASAFWQCYAREGHASWPHVAIETACTLVQVLHYTLRGRHTGRAELLALWLDLIEAWMTSEDARILARLARHGTPEPLAVNSTS